MQNPITAHQIIRRCARAFRHESPNERRKMTIATAADMYLRGAITWRVHEKVSASLAQGGSK